MRRAIFALGTSMLAASAALAAPQDAPVEGPETTSQAPAQTPGGNQVPPGPTSAVAGPQASQAEYGDIIVTAQKRAASINDVPMSITAATGDELTRLGITDASQLTKLVPGFTFNETAYGTQVFTIRGVGFQETTLGASPTVSTYLDEVPIPFSAEAGAANLDLERLEVLKGPQGTLFGSNATGGALNYIAAKPGNETETGFDVSFGSYQTLDAQGFISTPISDTLGIRVTGRIVRSDDTQKSYTRDAEIGERNLKQGRVLLHWEPSDTFRGTLNFTFQHDKSDSLAPQFLGYLPLNSGAPLDPGFINYPIAPRDNEKADWDPDKTYARDNKFLFGSLRLEFDLSDSVRLTSLSSIQNFKRYQPIEGDGTTFEDYFALSRGEIDTYFQEFRLDGNINDALTYIIGANYERDEVLDTTTQFYSESSSREVFGIPLGPTTPTTIQNIDTWGIYGNVDYKISDQFTLHGGIRYTENKRRLVYGCGQDIDGSWAEVSEAIQRFLNTLAGNGPIFTEVPTGGCGTTDADPPFTPTPGRGVLKEDNISWRVGVDWEPNPDILVYANVSRGYKGGSYPTLAASSNRQFTPVTQESLLAYEVGVKATIADGLAQANGAAFYYDYSDKQILGRIPDLAFGPLPALVNIPKSRVWGFEVDVLLRPIEGLRLRPALTYVNSRILDNFQTFDSSGVVTSVGGERFPVTPDWQFNMDGEYSWATSPTLEAFVGGNITYVGSTNGAFGEDPLYDISDYTIVDARAGVRTEDGKWRFQVWARNLLDEYYYTVAFRTNDSVNRFTGAPRTFGATLSYRY